MKLIAIPVQAQHIGNELVISFTPPANVSGVTYGALSSDTMAPGSWEAIPDSDPSADFEFKIPIGPEPKKFMQLTVTGQAE